MEFLEIGKVFSVRKGTAFALLRNIRFQKYFLNVYTIFPSSKFKTFRQRIPREYLRSINSYRSVNVFIKYYYEYTASRISPNTNNKPPLISSFEIVQRGLFFEQASADLSRSKGVRAEERTTSSGIKSKLSLLEESSKERDTGNGKREREGETYGAGRVK